MPAETCEAPRMPTHPETRLYDYQQRLLTSIIRVFKNGSRDVLLHAPCGAGKTLLGKAFAAWGLLADRHDPTHAFRGFHTVIVCAPLDTIVEPWSADAEVRYRNEATPLTYQATRLLEHKLAATATGNGATSGTLRKHPEMTAHLGVPGRAGVDWAAAGRKSWETRRRNARASAKA